MSSLRCESKDTAILSNSESHNWPPLISASCSNRCAVLLIYSEVQLEKTKAKAEAQRKQL